MNIKAALNRWKRRQFNYGDADCFMFACFIIKEMTGKDYASQYEYGSEKEAYETVERVGGSQKLSDALKNVFENPTLDLKDGDPCVVDVPMIGEITGVKMDDFVICITAKGMSKIPTRYLIAGWSL